MSKLRIDTGSSSFRELRENNLYYVDKTDFVEEFIENVPQKATLITRPRRFGKSMTLSMLSDFFEITYDSKELFLDLKISKNKNICEEWMNRYPVLLLDLKRVEAHSFKEAIKQIARAVSFAVMQHMELFSSKDIDSDQKKELRKLKIVTSNEELLQSSLQLLTLSLSLVHKKETIILIDEYDVPILTAQKYGYYEEMLSFMRCFIGNACKGNKCLKFSIMTGCLRIAKESSFSGLNNIDCYDITKNVFADKIGFTNEDVEKVLADAGLSQKKELIKEWYDGYCFGAAQEMYCPWDVLHYVRDVQNDNAAQPEAYWLNTSANEDVKRCFEQATQSVWEKVSALFQKGYLTTEINSTLTYGELGSSEEALWTMLYLTGYLTRDRKHALQELADEDGQAVQPVQTALCIPNKSIEMVFTKNITLWLKRTVRKMDLEDFLKAFWSCDGKAVTAALSAIILKTISCFDAYKEDYYHGVVTGIFYCQSCTTKSNPESGHGFTDLIIEDTANNCAAVIEIKRAASIKGLGRAAGTALRQIKKSAYDAPLLDRYETVLHWGFAFFSKHCLTKGAAVKKL